MNYCWLFTASPTFGGLAPVNVAVADPSSTSVTTAVPTLSVIVLSTFPVEGSFTVRTARLTSSWSPTLTPLAAAWPAQALSAPPPGEPAPLAAAVNALVRDQSLAAAMGRAGRDRAIAEFDWAGIAAQTVGLYEELTGIADPHPRQVKIHRD